ncbi:hypothetical protein THIOSC13_370026 [uncultured Thiomicrorhabdus sp.]
MFVVVSLGLFVCLFVRSFIYLFGFCFFGFVGFVLLIHGVCVCVCVSFVCVCVCVCLVRSFVHSFMVMMIIWRLFV